MAGDLTAVDGAAERQGASGAALLASRLERMRRLARVWDAGIRVPGTRWAIGLDPLIGLLPGLGDAAGAAVASYVLVQSARCGASRAVLVRMVGNIAIDALVGSLPLVGDLFDAGWKANLRNVTLLERYLADPAGVHRASGRLVAGVIAAAALPVLGALVAALLVLRIVLRVLSGR